MNMLEYLVHTDLQCCNNIFLPKPASCSFSVPSCRRAESEGEYHGLEQTKEKMKKRTSELSP